MTMQNGLRNVMQNGLIMQKACWGLFDDPKYARSIRAAWIAYFRNTK